MKGKLEPSHLKHPALTFAIGILLGVFVGTALTKCDEENETRTEVSIEAAVAAGLGRLEDLELRVSTLEEKSDSLETDIQTVDESVSVVWELAENIDNRTSLCCGE